MYLRRLARKLGLDRNPLRRRSDRIETWVMVAVLTVLLLATPFLAWHAGVAAYRGAVAGAAEDRLHRRYKVDAVLLRDSTARPGTNDYVPPEASPAPARWAAPDGTPRTGTVTPSVPAAAGSRVPIWIDAQGTQTDAPRSRNPAGEAFTAGVAAVFGVVLGAATVLLAVRGVADRRRLAGWQLEWMLVEPRWSGRH